MIELFSKEDSSSLGVISEEQLDFLLENLEEERYRDQDYFIDRAAIDALLEKGIDPELLNLLRGALGKKESVEIFWEDV